MVRKRLKDNKNAKKGWQKTIPRFSEKIENEEHPSHGSNLFSSLAHLQVARGSGFRDARSLLDGMTDAVRRFADGAEQSDDLTMMAIRYLRKKK